MCIYKFKSKLNWKILCLLLSLPLFISCFSELGNSIKAKNPVSETPDNTIDNSPKFYNVELASGQSLTANKFPIKLKIVFNEAIDLNQFDEAHIINLGTSTNLIYNIFNSGDNKNFHIEILYSSTGTIKLSIQAAALVNLNPSFVGGTQGNLISVNVVNDNASFNVIDNIMPIRSANGLNKIGYYNGRMYYIINNEIYSASTNFADLILHTDGTKSVFSSFVLLDGNKIYYQKIDIISGNIPAVLNLSTNISSELGIKNLIGQTMYYIFSSAGENKVNIDANICYPVKAPFFKSNITGKVYFFADDGISSNLYATDGTDIGTSLIKSIDSTNQLDAFFLGQSSSHIYFMHNIDNANSDREIFASNGLDSAGTTQVGVTNGINSHCSSSVVYLTDTSLYFKDSTASEAVRRIVGTTNPAVVSAPFAINKTAETNSKIFYHNSNSAIAKLDKSTAVSTVLTGNIGTKFNTVSDADKSIILTSGTPYKMHYLNHASDSISTKNLIADSTLYITDLTIVDNSAYFSQKNSAGLGFDLYEFNFTSDTLVNLSNLATTGVDGFSSLYLGNDADYIYYYNLINNKFYRLSKTSKLLSVFIENVNSAFKPSSKAGSADQLMYFNSTNDLFHVSSSGAIKKISSFATSLFNISYQLFPFYDENIKFTFTPSIYPVDTKYYVSSGTSAGTVDFTSSCKGTSHILRNKIFCLEEVFTTVDLYVSELNSTTRTLIDADVDVAVIKNDIIFYRKYNETTFVYDYYFYDVVNNIRQSTPYSTSDWFMRAGKEINGISFFTDENNIFRSDGTIAGTYPLNAVAGSYLKSHSVYGNDIYYGDDNGIYKANINTPQSGVLLSNTSASNELNAFIKVGNKLLHSTGNGAFGKLASYDLLSTNYSWPYFDYNSSNADQDLSTDYSFYGTKISEMFGATDFALVYTSHTPSEIWITDGDAVNYKVGSAVNATNVLFNHQNKKLIRTSTGLRIVEKTLANHIDLASYGRPQDETYSYFGTNLNTFYFVVNDNLAYLPLIQSNGKIHLYKLENSVMSLMKEFEVRDAAGDAAYIKILAYDSGYLFFLATTTANGYEIWRTDGTAAGTELAYDFVPGSGSSKISDVSRVGSKIYLSSSKTGVNLVYSGAFDILLP